MPNKFIALRIKPELEKIIKEEAEKQNKTVSDLVRNILELHFQSNPNLEERITILEKEVFRNGTQILN